MSAILQYDPHSQFFELRVRGTLKRQELRDCEQEFASIISPDDRPRLLVICDHFGAWEHGADWDNLDFMHAFGSKIMKIAIVGAGPKESEIKTFTGAGIRPTPIRFFPADQTDVARAWLCEG